MADVHFYRLCICLYLCLSHYSSLKPDLYIKRMFYRASVQRYYILMKKVFRSKPDYVLGLHVCDWGSLLSFVLFLTGPMTQGDCFFSSAEVGWSFGWSFPVNLSL